MIDKLTDIPGVATYLQRINAEPRSLFSAVIKEREGRYWADKATIHFSKEGMIRASHDDYSPTEEEKNSILDGFKQVQIPEYRTLPRLPDPGSLPARLEKARKEDRLFVFRGLKGEILMLQERVEQDDGQKIYLPWTFWSDNRWRLAEGTDKMPLFGLEETLQYGVVHLHEGAKAARAMQRLRDGDPKTLAAHPWAEDLRHVGHLGWCSGAPTPGRTDWLPVRNTEGIFLILDNDPLGISAAPRIAWHLRGQTFQVQFPTSFPVSFDMADPWPANHKKLRFRECLHPATWATDRIENKKGRPGVKVRRVFADQFAYIGTDDVYIHHALGHEYQGRQAFNSAFRQFSNVTNLADPFLMVPRRIFYSLGYRPGSGGTIYPNGKAALNKWTPTDLEPINEPATLFLEFLEHLIPKEQERLHLLRWLRTLACKPETRMHWSCLLIGDFGVGKSTLGWIAAHLVGEQNTSFPNERSLVSDFNEWSAFKRLAVIQEVHVTGHSRAVYQSLKSVVTDDRLDVNRKYRNEVTIENHLHVFACSNSLLALRLAKGDRRWFLPFLNEEHYGEDRFLKLWTWLKTGPGMGAILHHLQHADNLGWVVEGQHAPRTERKNEVEEESIGEPERAVIDVAEGLAAYAESACILGTDLTTWLHQQGMHRLDGRILRRIFNQDCKIFPRKAKIGGKRVRFVALNEAGWMEVIENKGKLEHIIKQPEDFLTI